jgi:thioredoxin-related protein
MRSGAFALGLVLLFLTVNSKLSAQVEPGQITWLEIEELEEAQAQEPRKVLVDLYTDWCGWCKRMDKNTFQNTQIASYVNEKYYAVKFNAERRDTVHFLGKDYTHVAKGRRGYHQLAALLANGKLSYPTIVYLDENLQLIQPIAGYMGPKDYEVVLHFFGENAYRYQPFEQFKTNFKSSFDSKD